jgi:hypothetical protein
VRALGITYQPPKGKTMQEIDFYPQAVKAMNGIVDKGILNDAVFARRQNNYETLAYLIRMGLNGSANDPVKFGLIFAVVELLDQV